MAETDPLLRIPLGPIEVEPTGVLPWTDMRKSNAAALRAALDDIALGAWDVRILEWLAVYEPSTVATVCSWLVRARYEGAADEARARGGAEAEKSGLEGSHLEREDCPRCGQPTIRDTVLGGSWLHEESGLIACEK